MHRENENFWTVTRSQFRPSEESLIRNTEIEILSCIVARTETDGSGHVGVKRFAPGPHRLAVPRARRQEHPKNGLLA
jgi:hypothetical protein